MTVLPHCGEGISERRELDRSSSWLGAPGLLIADTRSVVEETSRTPPYYAQPVRTFKVHVQGRSDPDGYSM